MIYSVKPKIGSIPRFHDSTIPRFHDSTIPRFHDSTIPRFHDSRHIHETTKKLHHCVKARDGDEGIVVVLISDKKKENYLYLRKLRSNIKKKERLRHA